MRSENAQAADIVQAFLTRPDQYSLFELAGAIRRSHDPRTVPWALSLLRDFSCPIVVRESAIEAIMRLKNATVAISELRALLPSRYEERWTIARELARLGHLDVLFEWLTSADKHMHERLEVVRVLNELSPNWQTLERGAEVSALAIEEALRLGNEKLLDALNSRWWESDSAEADKLMRERISVCVRRDQTDADLRRSTAELRRYGPAARRQLVHILTTTQWHSRHTDMNYVRSFLEASGWQPKSSIERLSAYADMTQEDINFVVKEISAGRNIASRGRTEMIELVGRSGDTKAIQTLFDALCRSGNASDLIALRHPETATILARSLSESGLSEKTLVSREPKPTEMIELRKRLRMIEFVGQSGDTKAIQTLFDALCRNGDVSELAACGHPETESALLRLLSEKEANSQEAAIWALVSLGAPSALPHLVDIARNSSDQARKAIAAVEKILEHSTAKATHHQLKAVLSLPDNVLQDDIKTEMESEWNPRDQGPDFREVKVHVKVQVNVDCTKAKTLAEKQLARLK